MGDEHTNISTSM